jgi:excisionase family DNA binding protein
MTKNFREPFLDEQPAKLEVTGDRVSCPQCKVLAHLIRIDRAARLVDVSRRTIYSYIEDGSVFAFRVAGRTLRICESCLLSAGKTPRVTTSRLESNQ